MKCFLREDVVLATADAFEKLDREFLKPFFSMINAGNAIPAPTAPGTTIYGSYEFTGNEEGRVEVLRRVRVMIDTYGLDFHVWDQRTLAFLELAWDKPLTPQLGDGVS